MCGAALIAALALAWFDVLPGGWRLRGLVVPHAVREERERAQHVEARLARFATEPTGGAVVFVGASTIERAPLAELFPGRRVANRGVAFARAREIAARAERILGDAPAAIVLMGGGPDRVADPLAVDAVVAAVGELARAVRARAPRTPVLIVDVLPSTRTRGAEAEALARIGAGVRRLAAEQSFAHVGFEGSGLVGADGALVESLSTDGLHLTPEGYALFAERLRRAPEPFASLLAR